MKRTTEKPSKPRAKAQKGSPERREPREAPGAPADAQESPAVVAFLRELDHPRKEAIVALRQIILGVSPAIREEIKWNAPSFRTTEHFATFNLRAKDRVRLILHLGAKVKDTAAKGLEIADPAGLLEWLAKDRCLVTFSDGEDVQAKRAALESVLRAWLRWI
ncbi:MULTISPECIES: DUF1801 domain-containing protein [Sorangium]|uniref:YdhG-like domain-containing protein n=1 Tax=Sorangium cellulosum (strain So ce56) TaxID=448385 RepID=A9FSN4_SORC5|nr:DUF1801 domain-containing protein [Sorangium cellulosum]CAN95414.1 hypothetical protein sce5251 [Sorangium cellulosum So ce56]